MQRFLLILFILFNFSSFSQTYLDFYFANKGVDGAILIYNEKEDTWIFNAESDVKRKSPIGSLFNLPTALIGLDLGLVSTNPAKTMAWDGVKRYYFGFSNKNWNCDTNLDEALLFKTDWYFQNVSDLIRFKNYQFFLNKLDISNLNYNRKEKYYWHFGGLTSTPLQQINFLRKLKNQELLFQQQNQKYVFDALLMLSNKKFSIHGYETYNVYKGERVDWWIGVLQTKTNTYFFSTRIFEDINKLKNTNFNQNKFEITLEIFRALGYI